MEISELNTKLPADAGAWMHLRHPVTGDALYDDENRQKPCRVKVRGNESAKVQNILRSINAAKLRGKAADEKENGLRLMRAFVIGFENLERDGVALTNSADDVNWFFEQSDDFVEQVMTFAKERSNFFTSDADD